MLFALIFLLLRILPFYISSPFDLYKLLRDRLLLYGRKFKHSPLIGVDNRSVFISTNPRSLVVVGQMHMSVDKIGGGIAIHQSEKSLKAPVRQIILIIEMICGRMGQQNIKSPVALKRIPQSSDTGVHLPFRILMGTLLVAHGAAQPQNTNPLMDVNLILHTDTAVRRRSFIDSIVVAVDIEHRTFKKGGKKGQIERT